jgi:N-acetyl-anhydromuramyl-L-alanine amidase AmpD
MVNIQEYSNFIGFGKTKVKKQIIVCHTSREVEEYLTSLKFRYNQKYDKIPHYVITKSGKILQLLPNQEYSNFFHDENINRNSIIVSLENLGWLEKKPLTNQYINWKGNIYIDSPYEKKWRDYFFWEPYTDFQFESLLNLSLELCNDLKIQKKCTGHNTKINGVKNFDGIVFRSNYDERFTDLNPSFNFEKFLNKIQYEQISR